MIGRHLTTRFPRGARRAFVAVLALILAATSAEAARGPGEGPGPLPWRISGRVSFTVDAAAFPDSAGLSLDVYVRIPPATLAALDRDSLGVARLMLTTRLRSAFGARQAERQQMLTIDRADTLAGFGKVVVVRYPTRSGAQRLTVKLEDLHSRKRGIAYMGRQVTESGSVDGDFQVAKAQMERELSDIEFVWSVDTLGISEAFRHGARSVLPNPERLYGLYAADLRAGFLARARAGDDRAWHWVARVVDSGDQVRLEHEETAPASRTLDGAVVFDVSTLPAGGYDLEIKAWQEGDAGALLRRSHFSIAWQAASWLGDPRDLEDVAHFLLNADAEEAFAAFQPGEKERFLADFWKRRDPTPETAHNEALETFLQRIDYANQTYSRVGVGKGMFSDMGRVYIRYGEPGEVLHQVIPAGDETLERVIQDIADTETRPIGGVGAHGLGGDTRPYEVWIYQGDIPLPPDADPDAVAHVRRQRLVFLFVDQQGFGQYTLRYSTE